MRIIDKFVIVMSFRYLLQGLRFIRNSINELFNYWYYYYQIRSITLWDFEAKTNIDADLEKIVR